MAKSVTIGARISRELNADLRKVAKATGRSKSRVVADALAQYLAMEADLAEALEAESDGVRAAEALALRLIHCKD